MHTTFFTNMLTIKQCQTKNRHWSVTSHLETSKPIKQWLKAFRNEHTQNKAIYIPNKR